MLNFVESDKLLEDLSDFPESEVSEEGIPETVIPDGGSVLL